MIRFPPVAMHDQRVSYHCNVEGNGDATTLLSQEQVCGHVTNLDSYRSTPIFGLNRGEGADE